MKTGIDCRRCIHYGKRYKEKGLMRCKITGIFLTPIAMKTGTCDEWVLLPEFIKKWKKRLV